MMMALQAETRSTFSQTHNFCHPTSCDGWTLISSTGSVDSFNVFRYFVQQSSKEVSISFQTRSRYRVTVFSQLTGLCQNPL